MQKVYLLLRNNQQMGPYSFEELLALHLKPYDLVWIEGKSHGWRYPNEVEALKPYVASTPGSPKPSEVLETPREQSVPSTTPRSANSAPKNIFVSMPFTNDSQRVEKEPVDPIEQKAEELRKRAEAYSPSQEALKTNYARELDQAEEEYTKWIYQSKTKKKTALNKKTIAITAISILIVSIGWWTANRLLQSSPVSLPAVVQQEETLPRTILETENAAQISNETIPEPAITAVSETAKKEESKKQPPENKIAAENKKPIVSTTKTTTEENIQIEEAEEEISNPASGTEEEREIVAAPVEKKKTLKEKINGLFKNKKDEQPEGKSEPGTTPANGDERSAKRRTEEKEIATSITDVSEQVEIKTNKIADSWMMGVKNLKLTLVNRSALTISSAKVEVLYYSEQNNLLEKKTISFANVAPGKSQTVAAPDQRLADHIEHKVVFANGFDNAYVSQ